MLEKMISELMDDIKIRKDKIEVLNGELEVLNYLMDEYLSALVKQLMEDEGII